MENLLRTFGECRGQPGHGWFPPYEPVARTFLMVSTTSEKDVASPKLSVMLVLAVVIDPLQPAYEGTTLSIHRYLPLGGRHSLPARLV